MQPNAANVLTEIRSFMQDAGALGLSIQKTAIRSEKADNSIVTEADLAISSLFQQRFSQYLSQPGHMLVDEEVAKNPRDEVLAADYQWVIDPIDGTATYAGHGLFWGIIVSVFRKGEPWLAAVSIPALRLLYWADETSAYETTDAFTPAEVTTQLHAVAMPFSASSQLTAHFEHAAQVFTTPPCIVVDYWSPMQGGLAAAGRVRGNIFRDSLWDFGAAFVMATRVGYPMRRIADGKIFTRLTAELLSPDWRLTNHMFLGPDAIYESLKPHFKPELTVHASTPTQTAV